MFANDAAVFLNRCRALDPLANATLGDAYAEFVIGLGVVPAPSNGRDRLTLYLSVWKGSDVARCEGKVLFQPVTLDSVAVEGTSPATKYMRAASGRLTPDQAVERILGSMLEVASERAEREGGKAKNPVWQKIAEGLDVVWGHWIGCPKVEGV